MASWPERFLDQLTRDTGYVGQIVHVERVPARSSAYESPEAPLPEPVVDALREAGVTRFYSHQVEALAGLRQGRDVMVVTGTASGKSLCYGLSIAEAACERPGTTALYLGPTKALGASQAALFRRLRLPGVVAETYDGDTPPTQRRFVREQATLVITNPDMLHIGILPHHRLWARFLGRLGHVVVDEAHSMRGVFGTHVALVVRRLRRLCEHYGSDPRFVLTSATCAHPAEVARLLCGRDALLVDEDGSPRGAGLFVLYDPPVVDERTQRRRSANTETAELMARLARAGHQTLAFSRSRQTAELIRRYAAARLDEDGSKGRVGSYRGGYLPEERREIEAGLAEGELVAVSATNALELGVDIPGVDAVIENGFPGTVSSLWQQAGRAGRGRREWLAVLVGHEDPLEQYYMQHPEALFAVAHEAVRLDPGNRFAVRDHVACAAAELPIEPERDKRWFGEALAGALVDLDAAGLVGQRLGRWHWRGREAPAPSVDIRATGGSEFAIVHARTGALVGTVEGALAQLYVHPGAVYLHLGETYVVNELDTRGRVALVEPIEADFYTMPRELSDVMVVEATEARSLGPADLVSGIVEVTMRVTGFRRVHIQSQETLADEPLDLPAVSYAAHAVWLALPPDLLSGPRWQGERQAGALHAAEHGLIGLAPLLVACDRWDVGGISTAMHPDTGRPSIFVHEGHAGGVGIAKRLYEAAEDWVLSACRRIGECGCESGCPSCVQSPKCGNFNEPLDKRGAVELLEALVGGCKR